MWCHLITVTLSLSPCRRLVSILVLLLRLSVLFINQPHKSFWFFFYFLFSPSSYLPSTICSSSPKACQNGNSQHLEHLLFYGADSSSTNASGNTALHICALYNKVGAPFFFFFSCRSNVRFCRAEKMLRSNTWNLWTRSLTRWIFTVAE